MKYIIFLSTVFSTFSAIACAEDPESVGGPVTDGFSSPNISGRQGNRLSEGLSSSSSNGASINSDCWGVVTATGHPGPGWSWIGGFQWQFIGGGGGGGNSAVVPSPAKLKYCRQQEALDDLEAILSATRITSSVITGLSVAEASGNFANAYFATAYQDINRFLASGFHIDSSYTNVITNWAVANINWSQHLSNWNEVAPRVVDSNGNDTTSPQYPSFNNGGFKHIFATHLMSLGLGSGQTSNSTASSASEGFLGTDPEPNIPC